MTQLLRSWVESANSPDTDFPLNNLPYGAFRVADGDLHVDGHGIAGKNNAIDPVRHLLHRLNIEAGAGAYGGAQALRCNNIAVELDEDLICDLVAELDDTPGEVFVDEQRLTAGFRMRSHNGMLDGRCGLVQSLQLIRRPVLLHEIDRHACHDVVNGGQSVRELAQFR